MTITIKDAAIGTRPATLGDLDFVWRIYRDSMKPLTIELLEWNDERQKAVVTDGLAGETSEIITIDGCDVGWLQVRQTKDAVELCQIYLAPEFQGQGVGTALVRRTQDQAKRTAKPVVLGVMHNNRAKKLYERLGFQLIDADAIKAYMKWEAS